jgi:hypothetical protein
VKANLKSEIRNSKAEGEGVPQRRGGAEKQTDPVVERKVYWVDVRDHLPDDGITVLAVDRDGEIWMGFMECDDWYMVTSCCYPPEMLLNITHWADLPEGPKEGV